MFQIEKKGLRCVTSATWTINIIRNYERRDHCYLFQSFSVSNKYFIKCVRGRDEIEIARVTRTHLIATAVYSTGNSSSSVASVVMVAVIKSFVRERKHWGETARGLSLMNSVGQW